MKELWKTIRYWLHYLFDSESRMYTVQSWHVIQYLLEIEARNDHTRTA